MRGRDPSVLASSVLFWHLLCFGVVLFLFLAGMSLQLLCWAFSSSLATANHGKLLSTRCFVGRVDWFCPFQRFQKNCRVCAGASCNII